MSSTSPPRKPGARPARPLAAILLLAGVLGSACSTSRATERDVDWIQDAVRRGRYEEAVRVAGDLQQKNPGDPDLEELHRMATVAYYLNQAREATFREDDVEAMVWLEDAHRIAPDNEHVNEWFRKTRSKLADRWSVLGQEAYASDDLPAAQAAYLKALEYEPHDVSALSSLAQLTILINYRDGLGIRYYHDGVTALSDYWLDRAKRDFTVSRKYDEENSRADRRISDVDRLLSDQRVAVAQGLASDGLYAAAVNEFKLAKALDPTNAEAQEGIAQFKDEAVAAQLLRDVQMNIYRREFEVAETLIEQGEALTVLQQEAFQEVRDSIRDARLEGLYDIALTYEHDQLFNEAIAGYDHLLEQTDFYKDARARRQTLQSYVDDAAMYYEKAMAAEDPEKKLEHLRTIEVFWPEYEDIESLIEELFAEGE